MDEDNSNPETGELSDDDAVAAMQALRDAPAALEGDDVPETDEDDPDSESDEPEADEEEPARYTVKIDGVESEVTLDELVKGFQLEADYRRKTQTLAEERREVAAEVARQKDITARLIQDHQKLVGNDEPEPDWVKLAEDDPIGAFQARAKWDAKQKAKDENRRKVDQLIQDERVSVARREFQAIGTKVPEWSDIDAFSKGVTALSESEAAKHYGLQPAEIAGILDHRYLLVLRDAAAYRALQTSKSVVEKKVAKAPQHVVKPGSQPAKANPRSKEVDAARNRFRQTGTDQDAVALMRAARNR